MSQKQCLSFAVAALIFFTAATYESNAAKLLSKSPRSKSPRSWIPEYSDWSDIQSISNRYPKPDIPVSHIRYPFPYPYGSEEWIQPMLPFIESHLETAIGTHSAVIDALMPMFDPPEDPLCDVGWRSHNGNGCENYGTHKWCKTNGDHYGSAWDTQWGKFEKWADSTGRTALVCPQCGCQQDLHCDFAWKSHNGNGCENYGTHKWCKTDGDHYGSAWKTEWVNFEKWADSYGRTALVCPQCGCEQGTDIVSALLDADSLPQFMGQVAKYINEFKPHYRRFYNAIPAKPYQNLWHNVLSTHRKHFRNICDKVILEFSPDLRAEVTRNKEEIAKLTKALLGEKIVKWLMSLIDLPTMEFFSRSITVVCPLLEELLDQTITELVSLDPAEFKKMW